MKSRAIDMIIDTAITVLCWTLVVFNWGYLSTVAPDYGTAFPCIMAILTMSTAAVGFGVGVMSVISYFTEK